MHRSLDKFVGRSQKVDKLLWAIMLAARGCLQIYGSAKEKMSRQRLCIAQSLLKTYNKKTLTKEALSLATFVDKKAPKC